MKKKSTKIVIILLIIIVLIIGALAAGVGAMIFTGKIALTEKQKLAKGINDIKARFSSYSTQEETLFQDYERMYTTPFESQTVITGKINELDMEGIDASQGASEIFNEIKEIVADTKITNDVQADLKNNIIVENLKLEMGDVVEEISLDFEYNENTIALRAKELNEKYLALTKNDIESNSQYAELLESFDAVKQLCKKQDVSNLELTEEEIIHFQEYYKGVVTKYLTEDMITTTGTTITVDGQVEKCSAVSVTFAKQQMQQIVGEYLKLFESDTTGKKIILNKLNSLENEITESDIQDLIDDLRSDLQTLSDDAKTIFTIYCNNFTTYGFDVILEDSEDSSLIKIVFNNDATIIKLIDVERETGIETEVATITIRENELNVDLAEEETSMNLNLKEEGNILSLAIGMTTEGVNLKVLLTNEKVKNSETETLEKNTINLDLKSEEMVMDITLNIDSDLKYISSIQTTALTSDNSLNMITGTQTELQQYIMDATPKAQALLQKAQQNSVIVNAVVSSYIDINENLEEDENDIPEDIVDLTSNQAVQTFNNMFTNYQGIQKGSTISMLLQTISTNNQTGLNKVKLIIVDQNNEILVNTDNSSEIIIAQSDIISTANYAVAIAEYDTEGYIKTIAIKKN